MRVMRVEHEGYSQYAVVRADGSFAAMDAPDDEGSSLAGARPLPLVSPSKIVCVGLNYRAHAAEVNYPIPEMPSFFLKPPTSLIGSGETIVLPQGRGRIDYEAELALVIGKKCRNLTLENARSAIFGITCANDVTARAVQSRDPLIGHCKSYDTFCPLGPWIETDVPDLNDLVVRCVVNGEERQCGHTSDMIFSPVDLLCFISGIMTLLPGDVVLTGTPPGVGPIVSGDTVSVEISGIGTLSNSVR